MVAGDPGTTWVKKKIAALIKMRIARVKRKRRMIHIDTLARVVSPL
jgi:hypothetical protein